MKRKLHRTLAIILAAMMSTSVLHISAVAETTENTAETIAVDESTETADSETDVRINSEEYGITDDEQPCSEDSSMYEEESESIDSIVTEAADNSIAVDETIDEVEIEEETVSEEAKNATFNGFAYTKKNGKVTITGYRGNDTDLEIPSSIEGYPVTAIGENAFQTEKGQAITSVIIPDGVTSIGNAAFYNCTFLKSVTIPDSVTSIGKDAFGYCSCLKSISIPDSVTYIGKSAFEYCFRLTSVRIPDGIYEIESSTFECCRNLTSVTVPDTVTTIGNSAFKNCYSLKSITIPDSVLVIENNAFYNCRNMTTVTLSDSLTEIGCSAFRNCKKLKEITIPDGVPLINECTFCGCSGLTNINLPNSITEIREEAFMGCSKLSDITIPSSASSIGSRAFKGCISLTLVTIPEGMIKIGDEAFLNCIGLTTATVPKSVTSIGYHAFYNDSRLTVQYASSIINWKKICISNEVTENIVCSVKVKPEVTAPKALTLYYTRKAQSLVTAGNTTGGTIKYSLKKNGTYTSSVPKATKPGTYKVYYKVVGNQNYRSVAAKYITVKIAAPISTPEVNYSISGNRVKISWTKVSGASGYIVVRSTSRKFVSTHTRKTTSNHLLLKQTSGTTKYYRVFAVCIKDGTECFSVGSKITSITMQ